MAKFKDLMHAILNEDVDIDDEELEDIVEEKPVVKEEVVEAPVVEKKVEEPTFVEPKIKTTVEETEVVAFSAPVQKKPSIFDGMNIDDVSSAAPLPKKKKSTYKYDRSKLSNKKRLAEDLEYSPIISPIFGNTQEEKKEFNKVHNAIELQKPGEDFLFTQIISPMYGNNIPSQKPVDEIPAKKIVKNEGVALEEMIQKPKKEANKQETLFED